jgi:hypothetical protein
MILFKKENAVEAIQVTTETPGFSTELNGLPVDLGGGNNTLASIGQWVITSDNNVQVLSNTEKEDLFYEQNRNISSAFEQNAFESIRRGKRIVVRILQTLNNEGVNTAGRLQVYNALSQFIPVCLLGDLEAARSILNGVTPNATFDAPRKAALLAYVDSLIPN